MKFDLNAELGGVPLRQWRELLRREQQGFDLDNAVDFLGIPKARASRGIKAAVEHGFIKFDTRTKEYQPTRFGRSLRAANGMPRLSREKADAILAKLEQAVRAINANAELVYRVEGVWLFGSIIGSAPTLGDIDVGVQLKLRPECNGKIVEANLARARLSGKSLPYLARLLYGETEVRGLLRRPSRYLSFHDRSELNTLGIRGTRIFDSKSGKWNWPKAAKAARKTTSAKKKNPGGAIHRG